MNLQLYIGDDAEARYRLGYMEGLAGNMYLHHHNATRY